MSTSPSPQLLAHLQSELLVFAPFAQMTEAHVQQFLAHCTQAYFEPGETLLDHSSGTVAHLFFIRRGRVGGRSGGRAGGLTGGAAGEAGFEIEAGDLFPIGAALGSRAVTSVYTALADTFCLLLPVARMHALAETSAPFADFLNNRVQQLLGHSRQALQRSFGEQALAQQTLATPLSQLLQQPLRPIVGVPPTQTLQRALQTMHDQRIGSVLVTDEASGAALGILTRYDVLGRVTLPGLPLHTPISAVMSQPVQTLGLQATAQDAALLMSRHGIRHVPVADAQGRVVSIISERDLFALQRLSLKQISTALAGAADVDELALRAHDIRRLARSLLGQGVMARQLTQLISHLNDVLCQRLVALVAEQHQVDLGRVCWLAFGSEGRSEQTISTDQDNGIVFASKNAHADRPALLAFARDVNTALDRCGYPLCQGNIMASNPDCCRSSSEWLERFDQWIDQGSPEDLLKASIFFDLRPLAGAVELAQPLVSFIGQHAAANSRFRKQLAMNLLRRRPALTWTGGIDTQELGDHEMLDLKARGTAIYVDVARLLALAHHVPGTGTRERFEAAATAMHLPARQAQAWSEGFEFLQMLRLRVQLAPQRWGEAADNPNLIDVSALNDFDRRLLKESLRAAQRLQRRVETEYP